MDIDREVLHDWHRLFGLLLTDFFNHSPFTVEIERDLSAEQLRQYLDRLTAKPPAAARKPRRKK